MVHGNGPNFATLVRLSWPFQRGSTVFMVNTMAADALAPGVAKPSAALKLIMNQESVLILLKL